jgi:pyridoxamine 5'-phosphate oxidase
VSDQRNIIGRMDYEADGLDIADTLSDPVEQFEVWFSHAKAAEVDQPDAMILSTASVDGVPSSRAVLLKAFSSEGFVFYTNLRSAKAHEISANPLVSLLFLWLPLHRQVRITGTAQLVDGVTADAYFDSRPREARIGAIASPQSAVIESRDWLEQRIAEIATDETITRPDHWGGYRVTPDSFEFWQGQPNRLHDRIRYLPVGAAWERDRLAP